MNTRHQAGFSWMEVIVCLFVVGVLFFLAMPRISSGPTRSPMTQPLSNMRQLHLATTQMALDGVSTGATNLGWPGDIGGTFSNWVAQLVPDYISTNDMCKLLSGPGKVMKPEHLSSMNHSAVLVYAVSSLHISNASPPTAVFLSTANFTNTPEGGLPLDRSARPFGNKGFVLFRKAGDGAILKPTQVGQTNIIGSYVPLCR